ncbi:MAG: hypothetical protein JWP89_4151 [Schlesneria sp.]|nr:hypothetical protein [Schlesneria sp.]
MPKKKAAVQIDKKKPQVTRDVGLQSKGPRLQKLRAVLLLIEATMTYPESHAYAAVEFQGDVFIGSGAASGGQEYVEENKYYDPSVSFTMNSNEVLNPLVGFCDLWISKGCSKHLLFGFYTPNHFTTEKNTERTRTLGIEWPDGAMLDFLASGRIEAPKVLDAAKRAVIGEYEEQVERHKVADLEVHGSSPLCNLSMIKAWSDAQWKLFFLQIQWKFGEDDAAKIQQAILDAIQRSPAYNEQLAGKELQIVALLMDRIDMRQAIRDRTQRFIHVSDVILAFKEVEAGTVKLPDPTWQMWERLPKPTDTRNIKDKVTSFCPTVRPAIVERWSRRATQSLVEQRAFENDKQILALKYHVFDACEEKLSNDMDGQMTVDSAALETLMQSVINTAVKRVAECSEQYTYRVKSATSIEAMVYELVDSCYLSFKGDAVP